MSSTGYGGGKNHGRTKLNHYSRAWKVMGRVRREVIVTEDQALGDRLN